MLIYENAQHDHYWIKDGILYESYHTIRGLRYRRFKDVPGMPDHDRCSPACVRYMWREYELRIEVRYVNV